MLDVADLVTAYGKIEALKGVTLQVPRAYDAMAAATTWPERFDVLDRLLLGKAASAEPVQVRGCGVIKSLTFTCSSLFNPSRITSWNIQSPGNGHASVPPLYMWESGRDARARARVPSNARRVLCKKAAPARKIRRTSTWDASIRWHIGPAAGDRRTGQERPGAPGSSWIAASTACR